MTWVEVDSFALIHNAHNLRQTIGDTPLWAVVKSNAYGHDLALATEAFWRGGVNGWMVTDAHDAEWLSGQRYNLPILLVLPIEERLFDLASHHEWHLGITGIAYFEALAAYAEAQQKPITVHLEIETGMHRTGITPIEAEQILTKTVGTNPYINFTGLFTHIYSPEDEAATQAQLQLIKELQFTLARKNLPVPAVHVLASNALGLYGDDNLFDGVRIGKALYGFCPYFRETAGALTWKTKIIGLGELKPGETIGYDGTYKATKTVRYATLPLGYADGFDRRLSNKGAVLVGGKLCPIIGRISMNESMIDVSGVFRTEIGEEVVILGNQKGEEIQVSQIAEWGDLSEYEFLTGINPTIKRLRAKS